MSKLAIVLCAVLLGSAAHPTDNENISPLFEVLAKESTDIAKDIACEIMSAVQTAYDDYAEIILSYTHIDSRECINIIHKLWRDGKDLIATTEKCIRNSEQSIINIIKYFKYPNEFLQTVRKKAEESFAETAGEISANHSIWITMKEIATNLYTAFINNELSLYFVLNEYKKLTILCQGMERTLFFLEALNKSVEAKDCALKLIKQANEKTVVRPKSFF